MDFDEKSKYISKEIEKESDSKIVSVQTNVAEREGRIAGAVGEMPITEDLFNERKDKLINFLKKPQVWVFAFLIIALILGIYIRSLPMQDHGGNPGLWDITKNDWTLGPDLDPWLFTRIAGEIVEQGSIPTLDTMRNVPLGFENAKETVLLPYMIAWIYHIVNLFGDYSIEFAAAIFPVLMFALTILAFFLFVREIFTKEDKEKKIKANLIALISTFFMIVIPVFLSRTIAGIPEKESAGFFFLFLAFFLFLRAWKQEKMKGAITWGILAGVSTAGMGLISGLFSYIYVVIFTASFIAFILNKFDKNKIIAYSCWWLSAAILFAILPGKVTFISVLTSLTLAPAFFLIVLIYIHLLLWETKFSKTNYLRSIKLPKTIFSLLVSIILAIIGILIIEPSLILAKLDVINQLLFKPVTGRWNITVAENRQPFFLEWVSSFGPTIGNFQILFWFFFIGSIILFKKMLKVIKQKDAWFLTALYVFFFSGLAFSRYSASSLFNGENFISKSFYILSVFLFIGYVIYYYVKYYQNGDRRFKRVDYNLMFLFALFLISVFSARSAVRLIMVLGPVAVIFVGYLIVESIFIFKKTQNENRKRLMGIICAVIILLAIFSFVNHYNTTKAQAYNFVPNYYNQQWQKAMEWVRDNTPGDAVFGHWWDYGYWVQSIGDRATVLDGGNAITFWNYWMGRLVLTGDNQDDALEFLYNHNTTHFLIDSSDIGKYGAFSSIGSNEDYDRFSWIGTFLMDGKQTRETKEEITYVYTGGIALDEDLIIEEAGKQILLPKQKAAVAGIKIPFSAGLEGVKQPSVIIYYNGKYYEQKLRYVSISDKQFIDFKVGLDAAAYIYPLIESSNGQIQPNSIGAVMFLSPRLMRGMLAQEYILEGELDNFPNFKIAHTESNMIVENLRNQGIDLPEIIYYQGVQGPIKIWEIEYTGKEKIQAKYLDKDPAGYLSWEL